VRSFLGNPLNEVTFLLKSDLLLAHSEPLIESPGDVVSFPKGRDAYFDRTAPQAADLIEFWFLRISVPKDIYGKYCD
jgi:hypothetical protein